MQNFTKKAISGLLSLTVAASYPLMCAAKGASFGDVNGDSVINSADALSVLSYCVGSLELTSEQLRCADVNADGRVNPSDALEILRYTVGLTNRFKADEGSALDVEEAVEAYNKAIEKAKSLRPSYTLYENVSNNVDDINVGSKGLPLPPSLIKKAEEQFKENNSYNKKYSKIVKQKSDESPKKLPGIIDSSCVSGLSDVICEINGDGNYLLTFKFKDENNSPENSPIVKVLGQDSYDEAKKKTAYESEIDGASSTVEALDFTYKDCVIKCEINPSSLEFINIDWSLSCVSYSKTSTIGILTEMKTSGINGASYFDFGY